MKAKFISCAVVTIIGITVGGLLAYLITGSVSAGSLAPGALLGGLIGLSFGVFAGDPNTNDQSGIGGGG